MMKFRFIACALPSILLSYSSPSWGTGFNHVLQPGRYRIEVIVEDPRNGRRRTLGHIERCLEPAAIANHVIFDMLSDTPASRCPKYEICAGEARTGFMAQCAPASPTSAVGMFALEPENFRGRIEVKDGDGQITNVEIQYGDRLGDCVATALEQALTR
jgi:hypothetical protein